MPALHRSSLADDPIEQFGAWYEQAAAEVSLVDAMALATVDADGSPDARMVLLKGFGPDGFRFFTNLGSAKARPARSHPERCADPLLAGARPSGEDPGRRREAARG